LSFKINYYFYKLINFVQNSTGMKKIYVLIITMFCIGFVFSQEIKPDRKFINKFYDAEAFMYEGNFDEALPLLLELHNMDPDNANVQYKLGYCYLNTRLNKKDALEYLEYSAEYINPDYKADNHKERKAPLECLLYLGQAYRFNFKFEKSLDVLNDLIGRLSPKNKEDAELIKIAEHEIEITNNAIYFVANPVDAEVKNMGSAVNTEFCDHSPVLDMNEEFLFFTSKRPRAGETEINQDEDVFISRNKNFVWQEANRMDDNVNSTMNEASIGLSADAKTMFIFRSEGPNMGNVMVTHSNNYTIWSDPVSLSAEINSKFRETHACLSPDGNTLYFVSNREGGVGGRDIYVMHLMPDNTWSEPKCLGPNINTIYDEETPFIHPDGVTMFFSSKGHNSMGGYDVFQVKMTGQDEFSEPKNLGFPINTPDDEVSYVLNADGRRAYMASAKDGGLGDLDIYEIIQSGIYINTMAVYNGQVTDINNQTPKNLKIRVFDKNDGKKVGVYRSGTQGYYLILQPGTDYVVQYEADGYLMAVTEVSPQKENVQSFQKKYVPIPLDPIVMMSFKYQNYVYFAKDDEKFTDQSVPALEDVITKNKASDKLIVNVNYIPGKEKEILTKQRGENIVNYLVNNGFDRNNIYLNGGFPAGYKDIYCLDMREYVEYAGTNLPVDTARTIKHTGDTLYIENIFFAFDKFDIQSQYFANLNALADYLKLNPSAKIEIGGHTDWLGSNEYNYLLSYHRSKTVKDYLVSKGANAENLITTKYGEGTPIAQNAYPGGADDPVGRQYNRRAEFKVLAQGTESMLFVKPIVVKTGTAGSNDVQHTTTQPGGKFTIQIAALRSEVPVNQFADLVGVKLHVGADGWYRYYVGSFNTYGEAKASFDHLKSMGYEPFIRKISFFE